jgi:DnaJ-domain-containing protein 1
MPVYTRGDVSIGKRLIDLARGELNSLLDRAARLDDDDDRTETPVDDAGPSRPRTGVRVQDLSDEELEAEIERRHLEKELREGRRPPPPREPPPRQAPPRPSAGSSRRSAPPPRPSGPVDEVARAYAVLEVKPGSDFETVRKSYRTLMRKYHPDRHASSPDKQKAATELAQKLSEAYAVLEKRLRR